LDSRHFELKLESGEADLALALFLGRRADLNTSASTAATI
jgi:hypothetical protein